MKYRYKQYSPGIIRPVIPIEIIYKNTAVPYEVLIDSGADMNIFDAQLVEILALDLTSGKSARVAGITGMEERYFLHTLDLKVGGHLLKNVEVGFLSNIGQYGYGVVGQKGFFDRFVVRFDFQKEEIELTLRE
ncbi:MAG: aspartyl protease family protein [bacterium]|nr:aspartyl protease family protein [bacterium]